jgi:hypothetical protein
MFDHSGSWPGDHDTRRAESVTRKTIRPWTGRPGRLRVSLRSRVSACSGHRHRIRRPWQRRARPGRSGDTPAVARPLSDCQCPGSLPASQAQAACLSARLG